MRKHLSYANVTATLALVFAMSGGALAAKHYLLNSVSQINPRVLSKLKQAARSEALWAQVTAAGNVQSSTPSVKATRSGVGIYEVDFPREISTCAVQATEAGLPGFARTTPGYRPEMAEGAAAAVLTSPGVQGAANPSSPYPSGNTAQVRTHAPGSGTGGFDGAPADSAFFIVVNC